MKLFCWTCGRVWWWRRSRKRVMVRAAIWKKKVKINKTKRYSVFNETCGHFSKISIFLLSSIVFLAFPAINNFVSFTTFLLFRGIIGHQSSTLSPYLQSIREHSEGRKVLCESQFHIRHYNTFSQIEMVRRGLQWTVTWLVVSPRLARCAFLFFDCSSSPFWYAKRERYSMSGCNYVSDGTERCSSHLKTFDWSAEVCFARFLQAYDITVCAKDRFPYKKYCKVD